MPCECPSLPCPGVSPYFSLDESTAQQGRAGAAANDRYRAEGKFGASCDLAWERQDDEFSGDGAGGTVQVKVHPGSLSLPHEQPQKDTEESRVANVCWQQALHCDSELSLAPQTLLCC